jgi:hypothetical protein
VGAQKRYPKHCSSLEYGPACLLRKLNSATLCLLLLLGRRRQVRTCGHRTLGIAVHRQCLFSTTPSPLQSGQVFMCASWECYEFQILSHPKAKKPERGRRQALLTVAPRALAGISGGRGLLSSPRWGRFWVIAAFAV